VNTIRLRILVFCAVLVFPSFAVRAEQSQKASRTTQEDRVKKLEERTDAVEKTANNAAMEKDYISRRQKLYEDYYQKVFGAQMWIFGIVGILLTTVFFLVVRFSLKMIDERTKTTLAQATVQMRNEYTRALAKEVQKLWDSNVGDIKKLREGLTAQIAEMEKSAKEKSEFQIYFVQALAAGVDERRGDPVVTFRNALAVYKSGKPGKLIDAKAGATTIQYLFESLRKNHEENHFDKCREELAEPLYNDLEEELALAALQVSWLTPLINERIPPAPEPPKPEPVAEARAEAASPVAPRGEPVLFIDDEADSCRLIET